MGLWGVLSGWGGGRGIDGFFFSFFFFQIGDLLGWGVGVFVGL